MPELAKGTKIKNRYEILDEKGRSVLGSTVYAGRDSETGEDVVIRVLPASASNDPEMVARFLQSAEIAKKLKHPNILPLIDAGDDDGVKYLVSRREKGFFLNEYLDHRGRLDEVESARLVQSLCAALDYAWCEAKIIHRNICPDTIFVSKGNVPKLTDFEMAKSLTDDRKLTVDGFTVGDPLYMSPEQAKGESEMDFRSDMYCLGLVFYQLLSGSPPFEGKSKMEILRAQVSEAHPPIKTVNPEVSDACSDVIDKLLAKRPEDRYASWADVITALDAVARPRSGDGSVSSDGDMSTSRYKMRAISASDASDASRPAAASGAPAKSKTPPLAAAAILLVAVLGVAFLVLSRGRSAEAERTDSTGGPALLERENAPEAAKVAPEAKPAIEKASTAKSGVGSVGEAPAVGNAETAAAESTQKAAEPAAAVAADKRESDRDAAREARNRKACANNLKQIGTALLMYANVFKTKFPEKNGAAGLDELRKNGFVELPQIFVCPSTGHVAAEPGEPITEETCDYVYVGGLSSEYSDPNTPIAWSKPGNHKDFGCVLYVSGEVRSFTGSNWLVHTKPPKKK